MDIIYAKTQEVFDVLGLIFDFFMEIFPEWLSRTIFGAFFDALNQKIKNKYLKFMTYALVFLLAFAFALAAALAIMISIVLLFS